MLYLQLRNPDGELLANRYCHGVPRPGEAVQFERGDRSYRVSQVRWKVSREDHRTGDFNPDHTCVDVYLETT